MVLRLRPAARHLCVGGISAPRTSDELRRGLRTGVRRHDPCEHLARLHGRGARAHAGRELRDAVDRANGVDLHAVVLRAVALRRVLLIGGGTLLLLVAAGGGLAYWQASSTLDQLRAGSKGAVVRAVEPELHRAPKRALVALSAEPSAQTILLVGSDHRQRGQEGSRSDTVMLARIQPKRHRIALLSIPRDLYVSIPGHGHDRINMAYRYGGERLLTRVVRDTLGVEIDHFVEVDFHGFKDVVQTLGGVWFPVDRRYYNRNVGTAETNYSNIDLQPGYQKLDGAQALAFARYRHDDNDFVRAARQQLLLRVVAQEALGDKWDLLRLRRLTRDLAEATTSDISSLRELESLVRAVHETPSSRVPRIAFHATDLVLDGADYVASTPDQLRATLKAWQGATVRGRAQRGRAHPSRSQRARGASERR